MIAAGNGDFPPAAKAGNGWPWTGVAEHSGAVRHHDALWPKITVVTPSYNQAKFLEETIRSVLMQGYPNLEYIILDGGSTDGSVELIKRYEPWITHWESRSDRGQSDAINRGLRAATGEIQCWINSDDYFTPGTLFRVAEAFEQNPSIAWLTGDATLLLESGRSHVRLARILTRSELLHWTDANWFCQQATFWRTSLIERTGYLNESLHYLMDWELWLRFYAISQPLIISRSLAVYRFHDSAKCVSQSERLRMEELELLLQVINSRGDELLSGYSTEARQLLCERLAFADSAAMNTRIALEEFGSRTLLREIMRRVAKRCVGG